MTESLTIPNFEVSKTNTIVLSQTKGGDLKVSKGKTIQESFEAFHKLNPHVYGHLVNLARDLFNRGHKMIGIGMLFEVLRWNYMMSTADPSSEFKLCNNYRSRYARMIMNQEADLAGCFNTRDLRTL